MKPVRFTKHAHENIQKRELDISVVENTIENPDYIVDIGHSRKILMKIYNDTVLDQKMLARVIIEEGNDELVVVTAYKTSQLLKYMREAKK